MIYVSGIWRRVIGIYLSVMAVLCILFWILHLLTGFSLFTETGATITDLFVISSKRVPRFFVLTSALVFLGSVVYVLARMRMDREIVVLSASGLSGLGIFVPFLCAAITVSAIDVAAAWWVAPKAALAIERYRRQFQHRILGSALRPGAFVEPVVGLTFYARSQDSDGSFGGVMIHDDRSADQLRIYLSRRAKLEPTAAGTAMVMAAGSLIVRDKTSHALRVVQFDSSTFLHGIQPNLSRPEREAFYYWTTLDIFDSSENRPIVAGQPRAYQSERNFRVLLLFYPLIMAWLAFGALAEARSERAGSVTTHAGIAIAAGLAVRVFGLNADWEATQTEFGELLQCVAVLSGLPLGMLLRVLNSQRSSR